MPGASAAHPEMKEFVHRRVRHSSICRLQRKRRDLAFVHASWQRTGMEDLIVSERAKKQTLKHKAESRKRKAVTIFFRAVLMLEVGRAIVLKVLWISSSCVAFVMRILLQEKQCRASLPTPTKIGAS